jgi:hypothetical protein
VLAVFGRDLLWDGFLFTQVYWHLVKRLLDCACAKVVALIAIVRDWKVNSWALYWGCGRIVVFWKIILVLGKFLLHNNEGVGDL